MLSLNTFDDVTINCDHQRHQIFKEIYTTIKHQSHQIFKEITTAVRNVISHVT